jgi:hypothetical protein
MWDDFVKYYSLPIFVLIILGITFFRDYKKKDKPLFSIKQLFVSLIWSFVLMSVIHVYLLLR